MGQFRTRISLELPRLELLPSKPSSSHLPIPTGISISGYGARHARLIDVMDSTGVPICGDEPAAKRIKIDDHHDNDSINVIVGPEEAEWHLSRAKITAASAFFRAACSSPWRENLSNTIRLPEECPNAFQIFVSWAYEQTLRMENKSATKFRPSYRDMALVWSLADFLQCDGLCNAIIDRYLLHFDQELDDYMNASALAWLWTVTPSGSAIQRMLVDVHVARISPGHFERHVEELPKELLVKAAGKWFSKKKKSSKDFGPGLGQRCRYHVHVKGRRRCR